MEIKQHKTLTVEKWNSFPFFKQILMIANEINRAKNWISRGDPSEVKNCYERALELIDLTVNVCIGRRVLKELLRFREVFAEEYLKEQKNIELNRKLFSVLLLMSKDSYNLLAKK
ncbi:MAG TPA: hypothetical protein DCX95_02955 [Elusimicrobia bacterium]|nr:hypothetical protein [Elusimicrobiota bacterium]